MTETVDVRDAQTHLAELAERAANGEEIVITRAGRAVARLVGLRSAKVRRLAPRGEPWIDDDFDYPLPSENELYDEPDGGGEASATEPAPPTAS
jgi:prevent-host-death family protein